MRARSVEGWGDERDTSSSRSLEGKVLGGRYRLVSFLGEGGVAVVWRARDMRTGLLRAAKVLPATPSAGNRRGMRLLREARVMAELRHPNIVRVHDLGTDAQGPWFVMDLLPGGSVDARIERDGPLPPREAVGLLLDACEGLEVAHARGVVHRDIKPSNLLIDADGRAVLADFGIALVEGASSRDTRTGVALGSMLYMPPEQRLDARSVGPTADVYALGATLYHALTGEPPLDLFSASGESPRWDGVPEPLRAVLGRAVALDPSRRHPDVTSFAAELREASRRLDRRPLEVVVPLPTARAASTATAAPQVPARPAPTAVPAPNVVRSASTGSGRVLVVDDDPLQRRIVATWLELEGHDVLVASNGQEALDVAGAAAPDVVLLDLYMGGMDGFAVLAQLRAMPRSPEVVIVTADDVVETVVRAMRAGAADYLTKPLDRARMTERVRQLVGANARPPAPPAAPAVPAVEGLIGASPPMQALFRDLDRLARRGVPVLVQGGPGTGKTHVARALHARGPRRHAPWVVLGCGAPDHPASSLHAWTRVFDSAAGGTLVLRDVGALPLDAQALLLERLDAPRSAADDETEPEPVVRLVATSRRDPEALVRAGLFLPELAARFGRHRLVVPELSARGEDLAHLTRHFLAKAGGPVGRVGVRFTPAAEARWLAHRWPGNVRELQQAVEHVVQGLAPGGAVDLHHLPHDLGGADAVSGPTAGAGA